MPFILMDYLTYTEKLNSLEYYIKNKQTVTVKTLAGKLDDSERTVLRMVDRMKLQGKKISYSKNRKEYFFEE